MTTALDHIRSALAEARAEQARWAEVVRDLEKTESRLNGASKSRGAADLSDDEAATFTALSGPGAAEVVIRQAGKPLHMKDIMSRMKAMGYQITNEGKFYGNLFTAMSRQPDRFKRVGKGVWTLKDRSAA